jgi:hypothetical protein
MLESLFPSEPAITRYEAEWRAAGQISPDQALTPFAAKALYAFGMMRHLIESAGWALTHKPPYQCFYISAYLLSCGAIELLGRCVSGDESEDRGAGRRLRCGLRRIASLPQDSDDTSVVVATNHWHYTIGNCVALRNFCAHGASAGEVTIDVELVDEILKKLSNAMDDYWGQLVTPVNNDLRESLSRAAIAPIFVGRGLNAILVTEMCDHVSRGALMSQDLMYRDAWQTYR